MKILMVIPLVSSYRCFLTELAQACFAAGWEVHLAADLGPSGTAEWSGDVKLHPIRMPRGLDPLGFRRAGRELRRVIIEVEPSLVHAHFSAGMLATSLAVGRKRTFPLLATVQGLAFPLASGWRKCLLREAERFAIKRMDRTWVLTKDDEEAIRTRVPEGKIAVQKSFGFGARDRFFDQPLPEPEERETARKRLGIEAKDRVLIFVGRWVDFKGFDKVVHSFCSLASEDPRWRLLLVGEADPLHPTGLDAREMEKLQADPLIRKVGWQEDVLPFLDLADLMVFPSFREGMPVSVMEALARRLPVIAYDVRGCRELARAFAERIVLAEKGLQGLLRSIADSFKVPFRIGYRDRRGWPIPEKLRRSNFVAEQMNQYRRYLRLSTEQNNEQEAIHE